MNENTVYNTLKLTLGAGCLVFGKYSFQFAGSSFSMHLSGRG